MARPSKATAPMGSYPNRPFQTRPTPSARPSKIAYSGPVHPKVDTSPDSSGQNISKTDRGASRAAKPDTTMTSTKKLGSD